MTLDDGDGDGNNVEEGGEKRPGEATGKGRLLSLGNLSLWHISRSPLALTCVFCRMDNWVKSRFRM